MINDDELKYLLLIYRWKNADITAEAIEKELKKLDNIKQTPGGGLEGYIDALGGIKIHSLSKDETSEQVMLEIGTEDILDMLNKGPMIYKLMVAVRGEEYAKLLTACIFSYAMAVSKHEGKREMIDYLQIISKLLKLLFSN